MSASVARILGGLLYYAPDSAAAEPFLAALTRLPELADWPEEDEVPYWCRVLHLTTEDKAYSFRVLFTAPEQGLAPVPPWGSVYQDAENRLDAASTRRYRAFLQTQQLLAGAWHKQFWSRYSPGTHSLCQGLGNCCAEMIPPPCPSCN